MPAIDIFQVDAFTDKVFAGNPAAVCPLAGWLPDDVLQAMTIEHNQSETAFFVPAGDGYELRWFTTAEGEIDLCGHATLASAHVIFNHLNYAGSVLRFETRFAGPLSVTRDQDWLVMDFPLWAPEPVAMPAGTLESLGGAMPLECHVKRDYLFVFRTADEIAAIKPDFKAMARLNRRVCITAPGTDCDFVSRFFCPGDALEEDPVTGSTHAMLIPYWAGRLGKDQLLARQLSRRGGVLRCTMSGERVQIAGQAKTYMRGQIFLAD